jgi:hypothetical protein
MHEHLVSFHVSDVFIRIEIFRRDVLATLDVDPLRDPIQVSDPHLCIFLFRF